jgi:hypothetical protein
LALASQAAKKNAVVAKHNVPTIAPAPVKALVLKPAQRIVPAPAKAPAWKHAPACALKPVKVNANKHALMIAPEHAKVHVHKHVPVIVQGHAKVIVGLSVIQHAIMVAQDLVSEVVSIVILVNKC